FQIGPQVDRGDLGTPGLVTEGVLEDRINDRVLGRKHPEDRALRDAGRLRDRLRADIAALGNDQPLGRRHVRGTAFLSGQRSSTGHVPRLVSEYSLINSFLLRIERLQQKNYQLRDSNCSMAILRLPPDASSKAAPFSGVSPSARSTATLMLLSARSSAASAIGPSTRAISQIIWMARVRSLWFVTRMSIMRPL